MHLHPTRTTFHVALAGATVIAVGMAARMAPTMAFNGAMILAVAIGRTMALATMTHLRITNFEMVWNAPKRVARTAHGETVSLQTELRNRSMNNARGVNLQTMASNILDVTIEPNTIDLPTK